MGSDSPRLCLRGPVTTRYGRDKNGSPPIADQRLEYIVTEVTAGNDFVVLLDQYGQVHTFGSSNHGELGHGSFDAVSEPRKVMFFEEAEQVVTQISAGKWHTAVLTEGGDVYAWGWNRSGQLGHSADGSTCASMQDTPYPLDIDQEAVAVHCVDEMTLVRLGKL
ncbi:RCC1 domain-containing protein 1 [Aphelenchoides avenae]|nr:RCC1 domain-containing protein 1 [Aphelenchus avenae]